MRRAIILLVLLTLAGAAEAQRESRMAAPEGPERPEAPALQGIDALRAEFAAQSGATTIYYGVDSVILSAPARATLSAQAAWIRRHPEVALRIEGYGDVNDTRDHAIAVGARRAAGARDYLLLLGVPTAQLSITSWGKERAGPGRGITILVR